MKINLATMTYNGQPARYVGEGLEQWPIVAVVPTALGGVCIKEFGLDGRARDLGGPRLIYEELIEEEDWS